MRVYIHKTLFKVGVRRIVFIWFMLIVYRFLLLNNPLRNVRNVTLLQIFQFKLIIYVIDTRSMQHTEIYLIKYDKIARFPLTTKLV